MANTIKLKKSSVAAKVPLASDLDYGELAINYTDGNLFFKDSSNAVQTIASTQFATVTGNVTGGNIVTAGQVSAIGNITGNYFIGDGGLLSNVTVANGNTAIAIDGYGGIDITVNAVATAEFLEGSLSLNGALATARTINNKVNVPDGFNAVIVRAVTLDSLANVIVPDNSSLTIASFT